MLFIVSGIIELHQYKNNVEISWLVHSDCEFVRITSSMMNTQKKYDYVTIGEKQYSGTTKIDMILTTFFSVGFKSNKQHTLRKHILQKGFVLNWNCLQWGEWTSVGVGTCKETIRPFPEYNGTDAKEFTKYRDVNEDCSKFIF